MTLSSKSLVHFCFITKRFQSAHPQTEMLTTMVVIRQICGAMSDNRAGKFTGQCDRTQTVDDCLPGWRAEMRCG